MLSNTSILRSHFFPKRVAKALSTQTYFFLNQKNKRQSASQSCAQFAQVVLNERSAWTTRSRNRYLTEFGQAPRLHSEDLGKDLRIGKQGESIALVHIRSLHSFGRTPKEIAATMKIELAYVTQVLKRSAKLEGESQLLKEEKHSGESSSSSESAQ